MKKYKEKLIRLKFKDMKSIDGIVIDYNEEWTLLTSNPVDYIIDGYAIVKNKNIKGVQRGEDEKWREKIIKLKKTRAIKTKISLVSLDNILITLTKKFGVFTLYTKEEGICWLGKLHSINDKSIVIKELTTKGKWYGRRSFKTQDIRVIEFDTDYINSLKLVSKETKVKK